MQYSPISSKETLYAMALTRMNYFNLTALRGLYEAAGNATAIMENRQNIRDILPDASPRLVEQLLRITTTVDGKRYRCPTTSSSSATLPAKTVSDLFCAILKTLFPQAICLAGLVGIASISA